MGARFWAVRLLLIGACASCPSLLVGSEPGTGYEGAQSATSVGASQETEAADRFMQVSTWGEAATPSEAQNVGESADAVEASAEPGPPPGWKLPQPQALQKWGINMGGWLQQGITLNPDYPADRFNGPESTNDRANE